MVLRDAECNWVRAALLSLARETLYLVVSLDFDRSFLTTLTIQSGFRWELCSCKSISGAPRAPRRVPPRWRSPSPIQQLRANPLPRTTTPKTRTGRSFRFLTIGARRLETRSFLSISVSVARRTANSKARRILGTLFSAARFLSSSKARHCGVLFHGCPDRNGPDRRQQALF